jgi:hypothetical protein
MHSALRAVKVSVHLCVRKTSEKNPFPLTFFQITEEDTDPVASGSSNQLDQESGCGFTESVPAKKTKKRDFAVDEACGLLRAVKKLEKIVSSPYLENLWRIKFEI